MKIGKIAKTIVAAVFAAAGIAVAAVSDDMYTSTEAVNTVLAVLGVFGVWSVPNAKPEATA